MKTAVLACAGAALAAVAVPASAPASPSPTPSTATTTVSPPRAGTVVVDCFLRPQVRPLTFLIACGDGNNGLTSLKWSRWGQASAAAGGLDEVNDCQPYCAAGRFHSYPVAVRLDRAEPWRGHPQQWHYTRLRMTYTANTPPQTPREVTYDLWD